MNDPLPWGGIGTEPVIGWRVWHVRALPAPTLISPFQEDEWPARSTYLASCGRPLELDDRHVPPGSNCSCGIYSVRSPALLASGGAIAPVVGTVAGWGRIVEHEDGWRAERAYPDRLRLICPTCVRSGGTGRPRFVRIEHSRPGTLSLTIEAFCDEHYTVGPGHVWTAAEFQSELLSRYAVDLMPLERIGSMFERPSAPAWSAPAVKTTMATAATRAAMRARPEEAPPRREPAIRRPETRSTPPKRSVSLFFAAWLGLHLIGGFIQAPSDTAPTPAARPSSAVPMPSFGPSAPRTLVPTSSNDADRKAMKPFRWMVLLNR